MSAISSWVLSIAGVCVMSVLIDLFLHEGQTSTQVKTVVNFLIIFVIIAPLPNLLNKNFNVTDILNEQNIELQNEFIYQLNSDKLLALEDNIENSLTRKGLTQIKITLSADIFTTNMKIDAVFVDLTNLVINENNSHIDIKKEVASSVLGQVEIEKEKIFYNG